MAAAQNCRVQKRRRSPRLADHNGALCLLAAPFNGSYRPSSCYGRPRQCASVRYLFNREIDSPGPPDTCFANARIVRTVRVDSLRSRMITRRTMFPVWSPGCECRTELVQPEIACAEFHAFNFFTSVAGIGISRSLCAFGVQFRSGLWLTRTVEAAKFTSDQLPLLMCTT